MKYSAVNKELTDHGDLRDDLNRAYITHLHQYGKLDKNNHYLNYYSDFSDNELVSLDILESPAFQYKVDFDWDVPFPPPRKVKFKFIDLFAGIGGFRIPLQEIGGKCVFTSEIDKMARKTYEANYGEYPFGDIREFTREELSDEEVDFLIPDHDLIAGGFPCQPFSLAGVSARNSLGQAHGFDDLEKGNLFLDIIRIAMVKRPKILFLENVSNLKSHDKGKTFNMIKDLIEKDLGYSFNWKIINANTVVPQSRKRFYIVCFKDGSKFEFPEFPGDPLPLSSILDKEVDEKYTISDKLWAGHKNRTKKNLARGTGFTAYAADISRPSNTLVARYYKDGKECLIPQKKANPRKLTPRECARLQGYPENFIIPVSDTQAYKQFGNSVAVPVIRGIVQKLNGMI
jgi:DNA (cytosine-5)-methyltransferase 1